MTVPDWVLRELGLESLAPKASDATASAGDVNNIHVLHLDNIPYSRDTNERGEDIDLVAVERVINGRPVPLTRAELTYTLRTLAAMGYSDGEIGQRIGRTPAAVFKLRRTRGISAGHTTERTVQRKRAAA